MQQLTYLLDKTLTVEDMCARVTAEPSYKDAADRLLIVFFPSCDRVEISDLLGRLRTQLLEVSVVGMTTMGSEFKTVQTQERTVCTFLLFEDSRAHVSVFDCNSATPGEVGLRFAEQLDGMSDAKAVFCTSSNVRLELAPFIEEISLAHPSIPLFGAQAGTRYIYRDQSLVFANDEIYDRAILLVTFCGADLHAESVYNLGWRAIGNEHVISDSTDDGKVFTIDDEPAATLYRRYLGILPDEAFFDNACSFPLVLKSRKQLIARVPIGVDAEGTLQFPGAVERGAHVRFSYSNPEQLMRETRYSANEMGEFEPQALLLFSCVNRRLFLGNERAEEEIKYYRNACPHMAWAYGYGEILRTSDGGGHLNSTIVALGLREGPLTGIAPKPLEEPQINHSRSDLIPLSERLVTLLETTTSELNEAIAELETVAKRDQLTGAFNRRRMDEVIHYELSKRSKEDYLVLLMYDIDHFKDINDSYGHDTGDVVLKDLTRCVQGAIRSGDTLGRWGGEEFLCLLTGVSLEQACTVAERIRVRVEGMRFLRVGSITISIGLTAARPNDTPETFFQRVDKALYDAKHAGRNCVRIR